MTYYADLSPWDYLRGRIDGPLVSVGWLENGRPVSTGHVSGQFVDRLFELLRDPWQAGIALAGWHSCDFCFRGEGPPPRPVKRGPKWVRVGIENLFVPGRGKIYVAPSMILHYVDEHRYAPPSEFQQAVLDCPAMGSPDYLETLTELGLAGQPAARPRRRRGPRPPAT